MVLHEVYYKSEWLLKRLAQSCTVVKDQQYSSAKNKNSPRRCDPKSVEFLLVIYVLIGVSGIMLKTTFKEDATRTLLD